MMIKNNLKISYQGLLMIMGFEGCRLVAYQCKAGKWTIGIGSTRYTDGKPVKKGDTLKDRTAALTLLKDTIGEYERSVNNNVTVALTQNQFDALVSFAYNEGIYALPKSHLLIFLNGGHFDAAADEFLRWDKITNPLTGLKEVYDVLQVRRQRERLTFKR